LFTDFREIAREGEGYSAVCKRIFGNTLEPLGLSFSDDTCRELQMLMRLVVEHTPTTIQSFSIGGHPYESFFDFWKTTRSNQNYVHRPFNPPAIPYEPIGSRTLSQPKKYSPNCNTSAFRSNFNIVILLTYSQTSALR
jgi:hypothetical protein